MQWNPQRPLGELPETIADHFRMEANFLQGDLDANRLVVVLIPAPEPQFSGHMIRAVESHNPTWYSDMYWSIPWWRRDRCTRALKRLVEKEKSNTR